VSRGEFRSIRYVIFLRPIDNPLWLRSSHCLGVTHLQMRQTNRPAFWISVTAQLFRFLAWNIVGLSLALVAAAIVGPTPNMVAILSLIQQILMNLSIVTVAAIGITAIVESFK
jgi:hypothetical protein